MIYNIISILFLCFFFSLFIWLMLYSLSSNLIRSVLCDLNFTSLNGGCKYLWSERETLCAFNNLLIYRCNWCVHDDSILFKISIMSQQSEYISPIISFVQLFIPLQNQSWHQHVYLWSNWRSTFHLLLETSLIFETFPYCKKERAEYKSGVSKF